MGQMKRPNGRRLSDMKTLERMKMRKESLGSGLFLEEIAVTLHGLDVLLIAP